MLPVVKAHQPGRCVGHTKTKSWRSAVPQEPVSEAGVSKCISYGVMFAAELPSTADKSCDISK